MRARKLGDLYSGRFLAHLNRQGVNRWTPSAQGVSAIVFAPDGGLDRVIDMPLKKVTSVNFGGRNSDILFVTSMAKPPLPRFPGNGVQWGGLFAIYGLGRKGVPKPSFGA